MQLGPGGAASIAAIDGLLADAVYLGSFIKYVVKLNNGQRVALHNNDVAARRRFSIGEPVKIGWSSVDQRILEE